MSTPAHTTLSVQQFLTKNSMTPSPMPYPPYKPDFDLSDFFCFPRLKKSPEREMFCQCGGGETKNGKKNQKASELTGSKTVLSSEKKPSQ